MDDDFISSWKAQPTVETDGKTDLQPVSIQKTELWKIHTVAICCNHFASRFPTSGDVANQSFCMLIDLIVFICCFVGYPLRFQYIYIYIDYIDMYIFML